MLTKSSLNAAYPLAADLAARGWLLKPVAETPLAQMINVSLDHADTLSGVGESQLASSPDFNGLLMSASTAAGVDGTVAHDQIMQSSVEVVSATVLNNINLARNIVNPMVISVEEQVKGYIASRSSSSLAPMSVVPVQYKAIWNSPILRELVTRYANTAIADVAIQNLALTPVGTLEASVLTGAGRFDDEVNEFLSQGGQARLQIVWDRLFGGTSVRNLTEVLSTDRLNIDDTLIAFLFARRVQEEIPDGVNMDVSAWRAYASMILAQSGRAVLRVLERRALDQRNLNLVISAPTGERPEGEIFVVGDNYTRWLEEGGSPEVLFGSVLTDRRFGYRDLLDRAADYTRVWNSEYRMLQSKIATDKFTYLVGGLREAVTKLINEQAEEVLVMGRDAYHELLKQHLETVKPKHLENIFKVSRKVVCRVLYGHTDAEKILEAVDASASAHPELELREAALLATVDYVTDWICKLFTVEVVADPGA